jgi:hypothetical protein
MSVHAMRLWPGCGLWSFVTFVAAAVKMQILFLDIYLYPHYVFINCIQIVIAVIIFYPRIT